MATTPHVEIIPRALPEPESSDSNAADWAELERLLREGAGTTWLCVRGPQGVHVRPLFAAWTGATFVMASKGSAAKSRRLDADGRCSLAIELEGADLVVEGTATRMTGPEDLARATRAMLEVYDWPTTVVGDELDAPYAAPSAGGPPFRAYEVTPTRAFAFPTSDGFEPTRFTF